MNYKLCLLCSFLFLITLTESQCKKGKPPVNAIDELPPETQTGENTFGCLINGKVFVPKGALSGPVLQCAYQYLFTDYGKGYFFQLSATNKSNSNDVFGIGIFTDSLVINKTTFVLGENIKGNAYGLYSEFQDQGGSIESTKVYTKSNLPGQLTITKFDDINQIVCGTFWFVVVKAPGDTLKIIDGRFDMRFTK